MAQKHNDAFKREAVRIALTSGLTRRQVASDLNIHCPADNLQNKCREGCVGRFLLSVASNVCQATNA